MPTMAAITVKKSDGVTDIVYDVLQPASGEGSWAIWRQDTGNTQPFAARPMLSHRVTSNGKGLRRVDLMYTYPYAYVNSTTSQVEISPMAVTFKNGVLTVPQGMPSSAIAEATAQFANLVASAHLKAGLANQTAFT